MTPFSTPATTLKVGEVKVFSGGAVKVFAIEGGFADVTPDGLTILAEQAVEAEAGAVH